MFKNLQSATKGTTVTGLVSGHRVAKHARFGFVVAPVRLPGWMQNELAAAATRKGFRSVEQLLSIPPQPWQPKKPFGQIAPKFVEKAIKLRDALALPIARRNEPGLSAYALCGLGVQEFQKQFGFAISARHWRRLFDRTVARDQGFEDWQRLEIYIDENIGTKETKPKKASDKVRFLHSVLDSVFAQVSDKANPSPVDRQYVFEAAFKHYEKMVECTPKQSAAIKRSVVEYMFSALPSLSKNAVSLQRVFELKFSQWLAGGRSWQALEDKRLLKSGNFRTPDFTTDLQKIRNEAILHGGNESLAYRKLRQSRQLTDAFIEYYNFDPRRNKSNVPATVRDAITPEVDMCGPLHRGPWEAKMRGPYIPRDWSDVQPGEWFSADDVTFNHYFYFYDDQGQLQIERGECLVLIDLRTGYPLDYLLIAGKYNSRHIRSLILKAHDKHGLPHKGFYFENGVWAARLIDGHKDKHLYHWRDTERGLAEQGLGMDVRHATTPRAKTIEGMFRILQERQRNEPGFVGFNEREEKMERMQEQIARARRGREHPANFLLSMEEWCQRLDVIFLEYANDPQNGKMLDGATPGEMWADGLSRRPLRKLSDNSRYLLSTHRKPVKVRQEGIVLTIGGQRMLYCNEQTSNLIGREVLAYCNVENPELLTVSDMARKEFFTVKQIVLPAMSATKEQFAAVNAQINGHRKAAKVIYGSIKHRHVSTITRDNEHDEETQQLGQFHRTQTEQFEAQDKNQKRHLRKLQVESAKAGISLSSRALRNPEAARDAIAGREEAKARILARERQSAVETTESINQ